MKVLLLAAGRSRRMQPIEDKNFLNFLGKPLIQHQLELLHESGFDEIVVVGGKHNLDQIRELGSALGMSVEIVEQEDLEAGMCGAVLAAKDLIKDGPVLVVSSNDVVEASAFEAVKEAFDPGELDQPDRADSYILGKKVEEYFPGGYLELDGNGMITNVVEKPAPGTEPSDLVNLVVHLHTNPMALIEALEKAQSKSDDLYEVALKEMVDGGAKMKAVSYDGFWQPIKFPWHVQKVFYHLFEREWARRRDAVAASAQVSPNAVINGNVIIEDGAKIFDGAVINGPSYIGEGAVVATNALVRDSNIGAGCVVGFSTEIARSFLGQDVWTHSNYIGDSVIGNNVSFGAGTVTGNLRLDEENIGDTGSNKFGLITGNNIRVGINTSFMPGVKIGGNSFIGAGIIVPENIHAESYVRGEVELKISKNKGKVPESGREEIRKNLKK